MTKYFHEESNPSGIKLKNHIYVCVLPLFFLFVGLLIYSSYSAIQLISPLEQGVKGGQIVQSETLDILQFITFTQGVMIELTAIEDNPPFYELDSTFQKFKRRSEMLKLRNNPRPSQFTKDLISAIEIYEEQFAQTLVTLKEDPEHFRDHILNLHEKTKYLINLLAEYHNDIYMHNIATLEKSSSHRRVFVSILSLGMLIGAFGTLFAIKHLNHLIVEPINSLKNRIDGVAEDNLPVYRVKQNTMELANLEDSFQHMIRRLKLYRELTDQRLLELTSTFRTVLQKFPSPVYFIDDSEKIFYRNPAAEALGDESKTEKLPKEILAFLHDRENRQQTYIIDDPDKSIAIKRGENTHYYLLNYFPLKLVELSAINPNEPPQNGAAFLLQDVTLSRLSNDLKNNLLETVSHELKTPITSARLALYLLSEDGIGQLNEKQTSLVKSGKQDLDRLLSTIENLLDLSRIRNKNSPPELKTLNLNSLVRQSVIKFSQMAETQNIKLLVEERDKEMIVEGDEARLAVVVNNFLSNALKHSHNSAKVNIILYNKGECHRVEVIDHGSGLPKELEKRIFDKFSPPSEIVDAGGGIGLHIAQDIIHAHDGKIGCSCALGKGCLFFFELPAKEC